MSIPESTYDALKLWAENKIPTGGFLEAVIDNDLRRAVYMADPDNAAALSAIVSYVDSISGVPKFYPGAMREWVDEPTTYKVRLDPLAALS